MPNQPLDLVPVAQVQNRRVVEYMQKFGSISPFDAFKDLGVTRLAARVFELRGLGVKIDDEGVSSINRFDEPVHYKAYRLRKAFDPSCD